MVVQLAKLAVGESGKVVAICSKRNAEMVKQLGADEVSTIGAEAQGTTAQSPLRGILKFGC